MGGGDYCKKCFIFISLVCIVIFGIIYIETPVNPFHGVKATCKAENNSLAGYIRFLSGTSIINSSKNKNICIMKKALVLGGTGATGKHVIKELRENEQISKIKMINRRQVDLPEGPGLDKVEQVIVDYDNLEKNKADFSEVDLAFCCLGTTRGQAGKEGFVKVDYDYVVNSAKILKEANCADFHLVSSKGAKTSAFLLYPSTKGKAEDAVKELEFSRTSVYRPGLLITEREQPRMMEGMAQSLFKMFDKGQSQSINTQDLARAMVKNAMQNSNLNQPSETLEHGDIVKLL